MKYYLLVDKINPEYKRGNYGRTLPPKKEKSIEINSFFDRLGYNDRNNQKTGFWNIGSVTDDIFYMAKKGVKTYNNVFDTKPLEYISSSSENSIIIENGNLAERYYIGNDKDLFSGFFETFANSTDAFETLMKSDGGSMLIINEKEAIDKKHFLGGILSSGLYFEHPKNATLLIPIANSAETLKSLILQEIIDTYEALGAKKIEIYDLVSIKSDLGVSGIFKKVKFKAEAEGSYKNSLVIKREFADGTFDSSRALENKYFIHNLPHVMSTVNGRIHGRQISDNYKQSIDLSGGINIDVLDIFGIKGSTNYEKTWNFFVEFHEKH